MLQDELCLTPDRSASNRRFYDSLWSRTHLQDPRRFNTWSLVSSLLPHSPLRLEIGPGLRPRLPLADTHFLDLSIEVVERLNQHGGHALTGQIGALPFRDHYFDLLAAFDVIEHVADDGRAMSECCRVLKPGGRLIFSVPLHAARWTEFDRFVGHVRRYEPEQVLVLVREHGLVLEQSAPFGMQPRHPWLLNLGLRALQARPRQAVFWYNWILTPLGLLFQKPLCFAPGLAEAPGVDEVICVCRRNQ